MISYLQFLNAIYQACFTMPGFKFIIYSPKMFDLYIQIYTISLFTWELQTSARKIARTTTPCFYSARE